MIEKLKYILFLGMGIILTLGLGFWAFSWLYDGLVLPLGLGWTVGIVLVLLICLLLLALAQRKQKLLPPLAMLMGLLLLWVVGFSIVDFEDGHRHLEKPQISQINADLEEKKRFLVAGFFVSAQRVSIRDYRWKN